MRDAIDGLQPGAALLVVLATCLGCASPGIPLSELTSAPIAVTYWGPEEARRRLEQQQEAAAGARQTRVGVAHVDDLAGMIGAGSGAAGPEVYPGRLALFDPQTRHIEILDAALPGARALAWSPDRKTLLFASAHQTRTLQLYEWHRATGEVRVLTRGDADHLAAAYGPAGEVVYAAVERGRQVNDARLYTALAPGRLAQVLAKDTLAEAVAWSPDGSAIVFARPFPDRRSADGLSAELLVLPAPGGANSDTAVQVPASGAPAGARSAAAEASAEPTPRRLAPGRDPVFTPDGEWIVYSAPVSGSWKLRRVRLDGTGRAPVGSGLRAERDPAISPDGRYVVYVADEGGIPKLFVRRFDGTGDRILLDSGSAEAPVW